MNSQETKDLQISLHTTISALSVHKDLILSDDTSSMTSSFTTISAVGSRNSPPPSDPQKPFPLELAYWSQLANSPLLSLHDGRTKARKIFQKFVEFAKEHGLEDTLCVEMLEDAIAVCDNGANPRVLSRLTGADKVIQKTRSTAPSYAATLQNFVVREIPIFNILEAMCWIYSCCVDNDNIIEDRDAEFYLYQLLLIFQALKATKWLSTEFIPSTVAAAWSKPSNDAPLTIAFACVCVGKPNTRTELNAARRDYVRDLQALVENCASGNHTNEKESSKNGAGNCPEFVAWGAVCRAEEEYRSLCLNLPQYKSYKCRTHCDSLAKAAWEHKALKIEDWYDKTILRKGNPQEQKNGYWGCELKSIREIIEEGRGRQVRKWW